MQETFLSFEYLPSSLAAVLQKSCYGPWIRPQRIHRLRTVSSQDEPVDLLREDECSFGMSGSKRRKLASLLPWLRDRGIQKVGVVGGVHSNHVVGLLQALREWGCSIRLFLLESKSNTKRGNAFLLDLLSHQDEIEWIPRDQWVELPAYTDAWANAQPEKTFVVPEGGACLPALIGASTLPLTWMRSGEGLDYDHVWMDVGTGFAAATTMLMAARVGLRSHFHLVQVAGNEEDFLVMCRQAADWWQEVFAESAPVWPTFHLYKPPTAKAFGAVNAKVWQQVRQLAQREGVLADPVYTAKLFLTAQQVIPQQRGKVLMVHGGGGTGLMGF